MNNIYTYEQISSLKGIKCGIYKITYKRSNQVYIGQSVDIYRRWKQHIFRDEYNSSFHSLLQSEPQNFIFEIVEECLPSELSEKEKFWIKHYNSKNKGFNLTSGGSDGTHYNYEEIAEAYQKIRTL